LAAATLGRGVFTINTGVISVIPDQSFNEDTTKTIPFTINDTGNVGAYTVTVTSSNQSLIPNNGVNLALSGSGANRTLTLKPLNHAFGTTDITVTVTQGANTFTETFTVTVNFVNYNPTVSTINKQF